MSLNQRLIRTNDTGGGVISNQLVIALADGYVYGAGGYLKVDAAESRQLNVIYHPIVGKHYAGLESDTTNPANKIYESSDGGATWSSINLPAGQLDGMYFNPTYNPLDKKIIFGGTRNATLYVYSIDNTGALGYNTISNFHPGSSFVLAGSDYTYAWVNLGTSQTYGGGYFFDKNLINGNGSSITLNTSMRLLGATNRLYSFGINWNTGHYKSFSDNNDTHYYTTTGTFDPSQTYSEADLIYSSSQTFANDAWFYVGKNDRTKLYRGTVVNSASSLVYDVASGDLSPVRYSPNEGKYYLFDSLGNVHSSTNGISWSLDFNTGGTTTRLFIGTISNFE